MEGNPIQVRAVQTHLPQMHEVEQYLLIVYRCTATYDTFGGPTTHTNILNPYINKKYKTKALIFFPFQNHPT